MNIVDQIHQMVVHHTEYKGYTPKELHIGVLSYHLLISYADFYLFGWNTPNTTKPDEFMGMKIIVDGKKGMYLEVV